MGKMTVEVKMPTFSTQFFLQNISLGTRCEIALRWLTQNPTNEKINWFKYGLVPQGYEPLPEPMLT